MCEKISIMKIGWKQWAFDEMDENWMKAMDFWWNGFIRNAWNKDWVDTNGWKMEDKGMKTNMKKEKHSNEEKKEKHSNGNKNWNLLLKGWKKTKRNNWMGGWVQHMKGINLNPALTMNL